MKKELSPSLEMVACDVCGRTILKGERTEPYLVPDGSRRLVCDLCVRRAEGAGWLRESLHGDLPAAMPRAEPRRSLLGRLRRRLEDGPASSEAWSADPGETYAREAYADEDRRVEPSHRRYEELPGPQRAYEPADPGVDGGPGAAYPDDLEEADAAAYAGEAAAIGEPEPLAAPEPLADAPPGEPDDSAVLGDVVHEPPPATAPVPEGRRRTEGPAEPSLPLEELPPEEPPLEGSLLREPAPEDFTPEEEPEPDPRAARRERRSRRRLRDPRHVRAVPTNAEAKVERALEVFNLSDYRRTVGGLVRTLGPPWVTALPHGDSTSEVTVVVAWELSWYQFRVDLGDAEEPVAVADKGHEVEEIDSELRRWNATATEDGALEPGAPLR